MVVSVLVYGCRGEKNHVDLCNTVEEFKRVTVLQLRKKIVEKFGYGDQLIRLIFRDKVLDDGSALLSAYGIQHMSAIHVVLKVAGGGGHPVGDPMGDEGKNRSMERLANI